MSLYQLNCLIFSEQLLVLIECVFFGDLLGYLRKNRGLKDTYYKKPGYQTANKSDVIAAN